MKRKTESERITYRPYVSLSAGEIVDFVMESSPSREFIFDLIVGLELAVAEGEFLERVCKHFSKEMKKQNKKCAPCNQTGLAHCQHPNECGGPWTGPYVKSAN